MEGIDSANGGASTAMLQKSLNFQKDMASTLMAGANQGAQVAPGGFGDSSLRTNAMQAQGIGQKVDTTA